MVLAALGLLASAWTFVPEWRLWRHFARRRAPAGQMLKLMTHNIFGLNYDMQRVAAGIAAENPDILALQEYFPEQPALDALLEAELSVFSPLRQAASAPISRLYSKIPFDKDMDQRLPSRSGRKQRTAHIIAGFTLADGSISR